ncbi:M67 family peptidase [Brevibacillus gelatini]|uniref:M67 family peptidase n=1 Tax=Brevibacillus gelatini TaxID=1655277 RepID=A0A3M8BD72_9BACL|nr:M67 family peptidase [Brevibacillus gelatini]
MQATNWLGEPFASKNSKIFLDRKVAKRLLYAAQEAFPYEYSALLIGKGATITDFLSMPISADKHAFSWDGPAFFKAIGDIRKRHLQWLGVLHTHPHTAPIPSARDVAGWHYPSLSYWIVSLALDVPDWRVYQWQDGGFVGRDYTLTDATEVADTSSADSASSPKNS